MPSNKSDALWRRLGWFVLLWAGGVVTVMLVGMILKIAMAGVS